LPNLKFFLGALEKYTKRRIFGMKFKKKKKTGESCGFPLPGFFSEKNRKFFG